MAAAANNLDTCKRITKAAEDIGILNHILKAVSRGKQTPADVAEYYGHDRISKFLNEFKY